MAEQTVTYLIGKDGKITVEVNGVRGPACRELVRAVSYTHLRAHET